MKTKPPLCKCGCGEPVTKSKRSPYYCNLYIVGHRQHSEVTKKKMSRARKKYYKNNPKARKKQSKAYMGENNPNWGKHHSHSEAAKKKISKAAKEYYKNNPKAKKKRSEAAKKYYKNNPEAKKKISRSRKEYYKNNPKAKKKISERTTGENNSNWGKHLSKATKKKISRSRKEYYKNNPEACIGENNPNWQGGISSEPYSIEFRAVLRKKIRKRDNYVCQICGSKKIKRALSVHHINYDKQNSHPTNLISLCIKCHMKTNGKNRKYWTTLFQKKIKEIYKKIAA